MPAAPAARSLQQQRCRRARARTVTRACGGEAEKRGRVCQKKGGHDTRGGRVRWAPPSPSWIVARGGRRGQPHTATAGWPPRCPIFGRRRRDAPMGVAAYFSGRRPGGGPCRTEIRPDGGMGLPTTGVPPSGGQQTLRTCVRRAARPPRSVVVASVARPSAATVAVAGGMRRVLRGRPAPRTHPRRGGGGGARRAATAAAVRVGPVGVAAVPPTPPSCPMPRRTEMGGGGASWPRRAEAAAGRRH